MTTSMTRRSVALGAPTALALGSLGPLATLATLGSLPTPANAAVTLTSDGFLSFYTGFKNYLKTATCAAIAYQFLVRQGVASGSATFINLHASYTVTYKSNTASAMTAFNSLPSYDKGLAVDRIATYLLDDTPDPKLPYPARTFTAADINSFKNWFSSFSADQINFIKQNRAGLWNYIDSFMKVTSSDSVYTSFTTKVTAAETLDDGRYLRGTVQDSFYEVKDYLFRLTGELRVTFGNARKIVERAELVNTLTWMQSWVDGPDYTDTNLINYGMNSTTLEPKNLDYYGYGNTSEAYNITSNQTQGIDYYVNADIAKNGSFAGMNIADSTRYLRETSIYMSRESGLVYEAYVATTYALRAMVQASIALVRLALDNKTIDLALLQQTIADQVLQEPSIKALSVSSRNYLLAGILVIASEVAGSFVLSLTAIRESKDVVAQNKASNKTTTLDADKIAVRAKLITKLSYSQTTASLVALGLLGVAGFAVSGFEPSRKKAVLLSVASAFIASDFNGGIADFLTVFRGGTQGTAAGRAAISGGAIRISGAIYASFGVMYKIWNWQWFSFTENVTPLKVGSITAGMAASLYIFVSIYSSFT